MTTKKCNCNSETTEKTELGYGFYSNVLKKPFERLTDLKRAEEVYYAEQKAKEDKAAQKKAEALKVEDAFKALNDARKIYKKNLTQLTKEYAESLENLKKAFELGKKDIHNTLAAAEEAYEKALKEFTDKHPEGYHLTLRDGDFETTISSNTMATSNKTAEAYADLFKWVFGL
jgi:tetratricopeptide (TPR) repeat protein